MTPSNMYRSTRINHNSNIFCKRKTTIGYSRYFLLIFANLKLQAFMHDHISQLTSLQNCCKNSGLYRHSVSQVSLRTGSKDVVTESDGTFSRTARVSAPTKAN